MSNVRKTTVLAEYPRPEPDTPLAQRTDRYKLIHFYNEDEWELFDLQSDPNEMRSIDAEPANADLVKQLKAEIVRLQKLYQVPDDRGKLKASEL